MTNIPLFFEPLKDLNQSTTYLYKSIPESLMNDFFNNGGKIQYLPLSYYRAKGSYWQSMPVSRSRRKYGSHAMNRRDKDQGAIDNRAGRQSAIQE